MASISTQAYSISSCQFT